LVREGKEKGKIFIRIKERRKEGEGNKATSQRVQSLH